MKITFEDTKSFAMIFIMHISEHEILCIKTVAKIKTLIIKTLFFNYHCYLHNIFK